MLRLYSTWGCHLCEQAEQLLQQQQLAYQLVDIVDSPTDFALYRTRIPVLAAATQTLDWPFDATQLQLFIAGLTPAALGT